MKKTALICSALALLPIAEFGESSEQQNQRQLRQDRSLQIGAFWSPDIHQESKFEVLHNISADFGLGVTLSTVPNRFHTDFLGTLVHYKYANPDVSLVFRFFPFESVPLYFSGDVGRTVPFVVEVSEYHVPITTSYTHRAAPYAHIGMGFRYVWQTGIFVSLGYDHGQVPGRQVSEYTAIDARGPFFSPEWASPGGAILFAFLDKTIGRTRVTFIDQRYIILLGYSL